MKNIVKVLLLAGGFGFVGQMQAAAYASKPTEIHEDGLIFFDYTDMVKSQEGADCGLHSIKNSIALFLSLTGIITPAEFNKQLQSDCLGNIGSMYMCRRCIGAGPEYLDAEALNKIITLLKEPYNQPIIHGKFIILENLLHSHTFRDDEQNRQLAEVIEYIHDGIPFIHAFVLGTMNATRKEEVRGGHWIACVLERKDLGETLTLHVANSIHGSKTQIELGKRLITYLSQLDPIALRLENIRILGAEMVRNYHEMNYAATLNNVRDILDEAVNKEILTKPVFTDKGKDQLLQMLTLIPSDFLVAEYIQYKEKLIRFIQEDYSSCGWRTLRPELYPALPELNQNTLTGSASYSMSPDFSPMPIDPFEAETDALIARLSSEEDVFTGLYAQAKESSGYAQTGSSSEEGTSGSAAIPITTDQVLENLLYVAQHNPQGLLRGKPFTFIEQLQATVKAGGPLAEKAKRILSLAKYS